MATDTYKEIAAYSGATQYFKYDIVTYNNEYWWAKKDSLGAGNPVEGTFWTQSWYFVPTHRQKVDRSPRILSSRFGEGYAQTVPLGISFDHNIEFNFNWESVSDREAKAVAEFVKHQNRWDSINTTTVVTDESLSGFWYQPPFPYTKYAGLYCAYNYTLAHSAYNKNSFAVTLKLKKLQASP